MFAETESWILDTGDVLCNAQNIDKNMEWSWVVLFTKLLI